LDSFSVDRAASAESEEDDARYDHGIETQESDHEARAQWHYLPQS
jgi:hypothetical protein